MQGSVKVGKEKVHNFRTVGLSKENLEMLVGSLESFQLLESSQIVWANFGWHGKLLFGVGNFCGVEEVFC